MPIALPAVQIRVDGPGTAGSRLLNGSNATSSVSYANNLTWSSVIPGGFSGMDFTILDSVRSNSANVYTYGANVKAVIAPGYPGGTDATTPAAPLFEGYLRQPTPNDDGTSSMHAVGYKTLVEERTQPLLWQTRYYGDWQAPDSDDFSDNFHNTQHMDVNINDGALAWIAHKGTDINDGNKAMLLWWGGGNDANPQHVVRRIAGALSGSDDAGTQTNAAWGFHLERFTGPQVATATDIYVFWSEMNSKDKSAFDISLGAGVGGPASLVAFTMYKKGPATGGLNHTWRWWIENLRINDLASGDSYTSSSVVNDLKNYLGFGNNYVTATSQNVLPLWWQQGTWADLMDYLAESEGNWKWGVWERGAQGPTFEFRDWNTGNTTWKVNCYGSQSFGVPSISASDDVYSMVDVAYKQNGTTRVRHSRKAISPNPFAGLGAPLALRQRTYETSLNDPQPNSNFADNIATNLANDLSTERYSGTVRCTYVTDASTGNDKSAYQVRAGDKLTIPDFPGGSQTFRIYEMQADDSGVTLTIGRQSMRVERMIWWNNKKQMRQGRVSSAP